MEAELPGVLPCDCMHEYDDHLEGHQCQVNGCDCEQYRPISRSEHRKREFEGGRAEANAKAEAANRSELKSQSFPTSPEGDHRFWVDQRHHWKEIVTDVEPFGVAVGDHPVVDNGPLDTPPNARYMSYKTPGGADNGLARARLELSDARIVDFNGR